VKRAGRAAMGLLPCLFLRHNRSHVHQNATHTFMNGKIMRVVPARAHTGATGAAGGTL
jgi:hypothetical protein